MNNVHPKIRRPSSPCICVHTYVHMYILLTMYVCTDYAPLCKIKKKLQCACMRCMRVSMHVCQSCYMCTCLYANMSHTQSRCFHSCNWPLQTIGIHRTKTWSKSCIYLYIYIYIYHTRIYMYIQTDLVQEASLPVGLDIAIHFSCLVIPAYHPPFVGVQHLLCNNICNYWHAIKAPARCVFAFM